MATCKACDADIVWADRDGKRVPFDTPVTPRDDFKLWRGMYVIINGKARLATEEDVQLHRELTTCHFDSCSPVNW